MLQEHENEQVYQDAQALIEKYFETEVLLNFITAEQSYVDILRSIFLREFTIGLC